MTPALALDHLLDLSPEVREGIVFGPRWGVLAGNAALAEPARALFDQADADQLEVVTLRGAVFALRDHGRAIAVVAARSALPAVMHADLRATLASIEPA